MKCFSQEKSFRLVIKKREELITKPKGTQSSPVGSTQGSQVQAADSILTLPGPEIMVLPFLDTADFSRVLLTDLAAAYSYRMISPEEPDGTRDSYRRQAQQHSTI